jgi:ABC-type dipeptide/oligopeptide/nickel transport system permease component
MARILIYRLFVSTIRFAAAGLALFVLLELAFCVIGGSDRHVWQAESYDPVPPELSVRPVSWAGLLEDRVGMSLPVLVICVPGILLIGYSWGVLGARLRRFHGAGLLSVPFSLFACLPGFWFVVLVAIYSCFEWKRPGFANDLVVEEGPDLLRWWHAAVVALPALAAGAAWQIRAVSAVLEREVTRPYVRGLFMAGCREDEIFYRNVVRRSLPALFALSDRPFPALVGSLVCLEYAFRYPGIASLLVESVRIGSYGGILLSSLAIAAFLSVARLFSECSARLSTPGSPIG